MPSRRFLLLTFFVATGWVCSVSQEILRPEPVGLAIELIQDPAKPPTIVPIKNICPCGMWYGNVRMIKGWKRPAHIRPVSAVQIVPQNVSGTILLQVKVFTGEKFHEFEELVAEFTVQKNESYKIKELGKFGVEPILVKLVEIPLTVGPLPTVENKTHSLMVQLEAMEWTVPSFRARFVNISAKPIAAFAIGTRFNGRDSTVALRFDPVRKPLIMPGSSYEIVVPLKIFRRPAGVELSSLIVNSVVFDDGTFEGEKTDASRYRATLFGDKHRLSLLIPILRAAFEEWNSLDLNPLISAIDNGTNAVDEDFIKRNLSFYAALDEKAKENWRIPIEIGSLQVKRRTIDALREIQTFTKNDPEIAKRAFSELIKAYDGWLDRVSR